MMDHPPGLKLHSTFASSRLPLYFHFRVIDTARAFSLVCSMRCMVLIALAALPGIALAEDSSTSAPPASTKAPKAPTQLPAPKAEPENPQAYLAPVRHQGEGPSDADVGPVQRHFVRASQTDDLAETQNDDNASLISHEKIALDKQIKVPLIHDVQNDGIGTGPNNDALRYEMNYLNWGAVTQEQAMARRGHYFTITWDNGGPPADFVARFEYREVNSKEVVRTLAQNMPHVSGAVRSYFAVTDKAYLAYGPIVSWRFTVLKGDTVVAEAKSFIW
jgi:hypothetical protein